VESVATCRCFKNYKGDNCELHTDDMRRVQVITGAAVVISVVVVTGVIGTFVLMDLIKLINWIKTV